MIYSMIMWYIYKITNLLNNKIYFGKTNNIRMRWNGHKAAARKQDPNDYSYIHRAINKYGFENFKIEEVERFEIESDALEAEKRYIAMYGTRNDNIGYNITEGGDGASGYKHTEKAKKKMSKHKKEKYLGKANPFFGKKHSPEAVAIMSAARAQYIETNKEKFNQMNIKQCDLSLEECLAIQQEYLNEHTPFEELTIKYNTHAIHSIIHGTYIAIRGHSIITEEDIQRIKSKRAAINGLNCRRLTNEQELDLITKYVDHLIEMKVLAKEYNISSTSVKNILRRHGIAILPSKERPRKRTKNKYGLTEQNILEIRSKWATNNYTQQALADEYKCTNQTIAHIVHRRTWKHI